MTNSARSFLAAALLALAGPIANANTQVSPALVRCSNTGPYYGRTDGYCLDAANKAPIMVLDGAIEKAFNSSLYVEDKQEFLGNFIIQANGTPDLAQGGWASISTASSQPLVVSNAANGQLKLTLDNGNEVGDQTLYWGDVLNTNTDYGPVAIFRVSITAPAAADTLSWGFATARNALIDSTTENAYFSVKGANLHLNLSSDDNSTDTSDSATGVDVVAATMYEYMVCLNAICGGSATNVKFFYRATLGGDWTALLPTTTFTMGANHAIQPFVQVEKTTGTTTPTLVIDSVEVFWKRQ